MQLWEITTSDGTEKHTFDIEAEYFQREDGWATFKDDKNKVVLDLNLHNVVSVARKPLPADRTIRVKLVANVGQVQEAMDKARRDAGPIPKTGIQAGIEYIEHKVNDPECWCDPIVSKDGTIIHLTTGEH
ncbi:hypothetical protein IT072_02480 [Leifsonia sp. ZF2019]|uniref:hypothetical protein n=1 Tax=Leifsonia sp. ZF2019 TaxID=2781978 RepID=UPI001CBBE545|nr:hypothetical protein [Leifsonia sp. ZF2019]UAJ79964.1 hypothetical protein IT072_02480 [Leifsonia sp. ZF2019]